MPDLQLKLKIEETSKEKHKVGGIWRQRCCKKEGNRFWEKKKSYI